MEDMKMKMMNRFISCADRILKMLKFYSYWNNNPQSESLEMELGLLRTFVIYASNWDGTGTGTGPGAGAGAGAAELVPGLGSLLLDIQAAFTMGKTDIEAAWGLRGAYETQTRADVMSKLHEKITLFRPQVKAAYEGLIVISSHNHNHNHNHNSNNNDSDLWMESLMGNLMYLCHTSPVKTHLCAMCGMLQKLGYFLPSHPSEYTYLSTHFEALLVRAACISYTCWVDRTTSDYESIASTKQECTRMLLDLSNEFKPITPRVIQVCLKLLNKSSLSSSSSQQSASPEETFSQWVQNLVEFLIPEQDGVEILRYGLKNLMLFLNLGPNLYKEDDAAYVELLSEDITSALGELGCHLYSFHVNRTNPALAKLLVKIELLKLEVFLMDIQNLKAICTRNHLELGYRGLDFHPWNFHWRLGFLQTFVGDASRGNSKNPKPFWMHIEALVKEASSVYQSYNDRSVSEDEATNKRLNLLDQIKLFKMALLLEEELLNRDSNLMVNVKDEIEIVYEGLTLLGTFLLGPLEENGKLILKHVDSVATEIASICCSFHASRITGDWERIFNHLLPDLVQKVKLVNAEIKETYLQVRRSLRANLPKTDGFGFIDFLLENLRELLNSNADLIAPVKRQIQVVQREIEFLRSLLRDIMEEHAKHPDLENLVSSYIQVAFEVEYVLDSFVVGDGVLWYHVLWFSDLIEDINHVKIKASEITKKKDNMSIHDGSQSLLKEIAPVKIPKTDEVVIELADQTELMIDRLTRGTLQQDVVSIVGMAGLGKTTLAKKIYNDPKVISHFHIRAWCCVSQAYKKRELLLQILGDTMELTDDILEMSDKDLEVKLYRCLKGKTYLIVIDDLWSIEAWNDISMSLANDDNGSRILITSRLPVVASKTKVDSFPHPLRLLSDDESWKLLQKKLFKAKDCPAKLVEVGQQIARSCKGLPLAVVAISGLLERTDMTLDWWKQVAETLSSRIVNDPETRCRDILELSYKYLPHYLKPLFLYLGAFVEDKEIPVSKLKWLWIADGLIQTTGLESVEDLAEEYLTDLVNRSLVTASKKRSIGGVKSCRVHDMLRSLCLLKCQEDSFLQCITGYDELFTSSLEDLDYGIDPSYQYPTNSIAYEKHRVSICSKRNHFVMSRPSGPYVRSLLYSASSDSYPRCPYDISFIPDNFKLLRVLDLECINMGNSFPRGLELLVHLRFLSLCGDIDFVPESIVNLRNLEILLVRGLKGKVQLPNAIWSMAKLRHVHVNSNAALTLRKSKENSSHSCNLVSLSSPSLACGKDVENIMRMFLKLRKLRCSFSESRDNNGKSNPFPALNFLTELESLNVLYSGRIAHPRRFDFPLKLRKLTLSKFRLPWDCISEIGRLPNLEVLKLLSRAFEGKVWDMKEGEFHRIKFLKLDTLNIVQWNASSKNLPNLRHLMLRSCRQLEVVPSDFGEIATLEILEVQMCSRHAEESAKRIKEEQLGMGNEELQVLINRSDWD